MWYTELLKNTFSTISEPVNNTMSQFSILVYLKPFLFFVIAWGIQYFLIKWQFNTKFLFLRRLLISVFIFLGLLFIFE